MASRSISVTMESSYRSSLSKGLRQDKQKIDAFQDYLNKRGFTIPVRINLKGFQEQAGAMRKIVIGAFADLPASILGADGRPASTASSGKPLTGEPDAGDLQVRFGGRGGANQCPVPTSITCAAAHRHSELSVRPLFRQRSEQVKFPNCRLWAEAQCLKQMLPCED